MKYLRNVSENNLGKAHEKRLLHPSSRGEGRREGRVGGRAKRKIERKLKKKSCCEQRGEERRKGWRGRGKEWVGALLRLSEMLTHSHAGLSRLFPFLLPAQRTTTHPVCLPSPPCSLLGWLQEYTILAVTEFPWTAFILTHR